MYSFQSWAKQHLSVKTLNSNSALTLYNRILQRLYLMLLRICTKENNISSQRQFRLFNTAAQTYNHAIWISFEYLTSSLIKWQKPQIVFLLMKNWCDEQNNTNLGKSFSKYAIIYTMQSISRSKNFRANTTGWWQYCQDKISNTVMAEKMDKDLKKNARF